MRLLNDPPRLAKLADQGRDVAATAAKLLLASPDPATALKGELGTFKRATWSAEMSLHDVKAIGHKFGATVNDVMLTAVTGALARYLRDRGEGLHDVEIRATIPANLRGPGAEAELGNRVGALLLDLPVGITEPNARLSEVKRRMDRIKGSPEAAMTSMGLSLVGWLDPSAQRLLWNLLGDKATVVITNVKGPEQRLSLAGAPVKGIMAWVPKSGGLAIGVSILSYADGIRLGVITDAGLVPDPETIVAKFEAEFEALLALARETKEMPSPADLVAKLDDALTMLDSLLEDAATESDSPQAEAQLRCQALTKAGRQCRNRALPGSDHCQVHT
jgi:WS/DGAT/MGAT family acyltransferase